MPADSVSEPADSEFIRFLTDSGWVVNLEEFRSSPERYHKLRLPFWLSEWPNAWLVIPLASISELIGFVVLATARARIDVNWEVDDLLKTAARQAATFLGQMQATEALLEARKFDAFNRMSAFVVHDLKNIVAQLSLMLKNAERHRDNVVEIAAQHAPIAGAAGVVGHARRLAFEHRAHPVRPRPAVTQAGMLAAADASPKLVQLADAEAVGVDHDHHRRIRYIHADLDDGGADEHIDLARAELAHHGVLFVAGQPTVHQAEAQPGKLPAA